MRKIEFRGKPKAGYNYGKDWLYGSLIKIDENNYGIIEPEDISCDENGYIDYAHTPVQIETIGQFTGLTDKNGKEIYEGDIVLCKEFDNKGMSLLGHSERELFTIDELKGRKNAEYISEVFYNEANFYVNEGSRCEVPLCCFFGNMKNSSPIYEIKIIGSIHDNPELLTPEIEI